MIKKSAYASDAQKKIFKLTCFWLLLFILPQFEGCIDAGTHGTIKGYSYSVTKLVLQNAVEKVICTTQNIQRDTVKNYYIDNSKGKEDTVFNNYYNDGNDYLIIFITKANVTYRYTLKYGGSEKSWDTARVSSIFIAYAYDENGKGGSEGNRGVTWYTPFLKQRFINLFENEFIDKVDKELRLKHTD